jgi:hypothetical protein
MPTEKGRIEIEPRWLSLADERRLAPDHPHRKRTLTKAPTHR